MNREEKEAIELLKEIADVRSCVTGDDLFEKDALTLLNLIDKQQKVIDKMYSYLDQVQICRNINKYSCIVRPEKCKQCILDYFYKEIENE